MKSLLPIGLFLLFCSYSLMAQPLFEVQPTNNAPKGFDRLFTKQVEIFGISIFATAKTPDSKILHAAGLLAHLDDTRFTRQGQGCHRQGIEPTAGRRRHLHFP